MTYAEMVGERLRNIRLQKGLSLHDVEISSTKEFKASVLGAYERGERSISVPRLQRLARFYGVPVDHLLPRDPEDEDVATPAAAVVEKIRIDLQRLDLANDPDKNIFQRYLNLVQMQRGDFNGKVLTIRKDDLRAIASVMDVTPEALAGKIDRMGIKAAIIA
ncbi:MAG: transcriptional regulator [Actinomycetota bacterium]|nr:transcriptional regulator [Actinomycetota bacterium]